MTDTIKDGIIITAIFAFGMIGSTEQFADFMIKSIKEMLQCLNLFVGLF